MRRPPLLQMTTIGCGASSTADSGHTINSLEDPRYHPVSHVGESLRGSETKPHFMSLSIPDTYLIKAILTFLGKLVTQTVTAQLSMYPAGDWKWPHACIARNWTKPQHIGEGGCHLSRSTVLSTDHVYHTIYFVCLPVITDTRLRGPQHRAQLKMGEVVTCSPDQHRSPPVADQLFPSDWPRSSSNNKLIKTFHFNTIKTNQHLQHHQ